MYDTFPAVPDEDLFLKLCALCPLWEALLVGAGVVHESDTALRWYLGSWERNKGVAVGEEGGM